MLAESPTPDTGTPVDPLAIAGVNLDGLRQWAQQLGMTLEELHEAFADYPGTVENVRRMMGTFIPEVVCGELALQLGAAHKPDQYLEAEYPMLTQTRVDAGQSGRSFFAANIAGVK